MQPVFQDMGLFKGGEISSCRGVVEAVGYLMKQWLNDIDIRKLCLVIEQMKD